MVEITEAFNPVMALSVAGIVAGAAFLSKRPKQLLRDFFTEFAGSLVLYHLFFVGCTFIINHQSIPRGVDWIYHALCVVGLHFGTSRASMNPAISAGAWIYGMIDHWTLVAHITAQIYASQFGFYSLKTMNSILGDELAAAIQGPSFSHLSEVQKLPHFGIEVGGENNEVLHALFTEGVMTFVLALVIFLVEKRVKNGLMKISIIAATIRLCMYFGEDITGANMNPMIAYSWLFYFSKGSSSLIGAFYQKEYIVVYCVAPMIAAGFAALLVSMLPEYDDVVPEKPVKNVPAAKKEPTAAPAPASKGRTSSRGRGKKVEEEPETEEESKEEESESEPEPEPVVKKPASRARGRTASRGPAKKAAASPKPSPSPVRRKSGRGKK